MINLKNRKGKKKEEIEEKKKHLSLVIPEIT